MFLGFTKRVSFQAEKLLVTIIPTDPGPRVLQLADTPVNGLGIGQHNYLSLLSNQSCARRRLFSGDATVHKVFCARPAALASYRERQK